MRFSILVLLLAFFMTPPHKIKVYLIGDSTMSNKEKKAFPETGWGMPFASFFDSTVQVDNRAQNGRSTKSFIEGKIWQPVYDSLREGDYVLIQFGHNDEVKEKVGRYTTPDEFKNNLTKFIIETRNKKAIPILITPVARRQFDSLGHVIETHEIYSGLVREVAKEYNTSLIDLDKLSQSLLQQFGKEYSSLLYNQLVPGEHPNYPNGVQDNTHFNEYGARRMAELVLSGIRKLDLDLVARIVHK